ncbi:hypothetical protein A8V01_13770 [Novosphingobium guangzhouense]|uniref:Uncharacterized protein n=1 Tax=Novosphingobium guangzhouense TaxID=1850347 RepID=A0A2K2G4A8_9SPHN|nr:hypothetical protein A8V01_13770 [Novosphingobium guangzhouense]
MGSALATSHRHVATGAGTERFGARVGGTARFDDAFAKNRWARVSSNVQAARGSLKLILIQRSPR